MIPRTIIVLLALVFVACSNSPMEKTANADSSTFKFNALIGFWKQSVTDSADTNRWNFEGWMLLNKNLYGTRTTVNGKVASMHATLVLNPLPESPVLSLRHLIGQKGELIPRNLMGQKGELIPFRCISQNQNRIQFVNESNDFPQLICYEFTADDTLILTESTVGGNGESIQQTAVYIREKKK